MISQTFLLKKIIGSLKTYMNNLQRFEITNVPKNVKTAISQYCKDKGVTRARYLSDDKRIKTYL